MFMSCQQDVVGIHNYNITTANKSVEKVTKFTCRVWERQ
jgi:hypothetical protein